MKIVFVSQPLSTGGAERVVASLANKFSEWGHLVQIIVVDNGDDNVYYTRPEIKFYHIKKIQNPILDLMYRAKEMRHFFSEYRPDIIISFTTQKNVSTLLATLFSDHRVIACERNNPASDPSNQFLRVLRKLLFWTADGYVFQTREARDYFSRRIKRRSCVIPNPIKEDIIPVWNGNREKKIVMASRLHPQKNLDMAIDVMASISKIHPDYTLEIYGKSYSGQYDYENSLKQRVHDEGLDEIVLFKGFSSSIHENMKDALIFLITSNHEGMSNSLMEAMALGLPCISTDDSNGGARALIRDHKNGLLVSVGGVQECIQAVEELITNQELRELLSRNAQTIRDTLSIDKVAKKWIEYIQKVVS